MQIPESYELIREEELPDIHARGIYLRHRKSGAHVALVPAEDINKVFHITFRTPPRDSTGVAHIIEHTVLCGSKEFPLKDPFVELVKGSLNTFLNAITYPDKTMYPVASTNDADFRNLMHVYLDAVFYPNIGRDERIFRQEGWHYEMNSPEDPLTINGVVYNEMKGAFSSPDDIFERQIMNALFPDTPYGVESGGDPEVIPTLSYEDYLAFHKAYYHPSNSYIYLYGDLDMADTLRWMDEHYLSHFSKIEVNSAIPMQKAFSEERKVVAKYPLASEESEEGKSYLSFNVVGGDPFNMEESIAFDVLDYALFSAPGAPVREALTRAGIGQDVYGAYNDGTLQPYFSVVAKNAEASDADRFEQIIRDVLQEQVERGINPMSLEAGLNALEFQFREADYSQFPKGLIYGIDIMDSWLYDEDQPFTYLKQLDAYASLRKKAKEGYFEKLIDEKILHNPFAAVVILEPEKGLEAKRSEALVRKLADRKAAMSKEEIHKIVAETEDLHAWQESPETPEALSTIPFLTRDELRREVLPLSNKEEDISGIPTVYHTAVTNGIGYVEMLFPMNSLPDDLLPYAALLKAALANVATRDHTYMDLNNEINARTGGISFGIASYDDPQVENGYLAYFGVHAKALYANMGDVTSLVREIVMDSDFSDTQHLFEIFAAAKAQMEAYLMQAGHTAAAGRAAAYLFPVSAFTDRISGISFYKWLSDLVDNFEERGGEIAEKLKEVAADIFQMDKCILSYTSEESGREAFSNAVKKDLLVLYPAGKVGENHVVEPLGLLNEGFMTSGQVQFDALVGDYRKAGAYTGAMQIFRQLMSYEYLWQNIRMKGGAYGCSAVMARNGRTAFVTYRDPHLLRSKEIFEEAPDYLENFTADEKQMTKYIIGTLSVVDTPMTPSMFGSASMGAYISGVTAEERQKHRNEILDATEDDIRALAPVCREALSSGAFCVIGGESRIKDHQDLFGKTEYLL
ncbi:MAG: insulinase family protein [Lachnospiraceae bacterium]|nr:insulinase family protein [Lachnospiraceae bacterium]